MEGMETEYDLTIWIPTYNRPTDLKKTLKQIEQLEINKYINVVVSDNCSSKMDESIEELIRKLPNIELIKNRYNLSAGANFMKAFEACNTTWIHILSDDEILHQNYLETIRNEFEQIDKFTIAIKFDTELYGKQSRCKASDLGEVIHRIPRSEINNWFNNLLLVSSWIFKRDSYGDNLRSGYLGYGTKLSHILPILSSCDVDKRRVINFSSMQICHFQSNDDSWPRAASWVEMCINTQIGHGYLSVENKTALKRCLFGGSYAKLIAKILRIRSFYRHKDNGVSWFKILFIISIMSKTFMVLSAVLLPLLLFPRKLWPIYLRKKLGNEGSIERW